MMASFEPLENPPDFGPPPERKRPRHDPAKIEPVLEFPFIEATVKPTVERKRYPPLTISKTVSINREVPAECSKRNVDSDSKDAVVFKPSGGVSKGDIKGRGCPPPRDLKGFPVLRDFPSGCASHFASTSQRSPKQINSKLNVDYDSDNVVAFKPSGGASKGDVNPRSLNGFPVGCDFLSGCSSNYASTGRRSPKQINSKRNVDSDYDSEDVILFKPSGGVGKGEIKVREYHPLGNLKGFSVCHDFLSRCTSHAASTSRRYPKEKNNVASSSRLNVDSLGIADECGAVDVVVSKEKCSKDMIKNTLKQYWEVLASIKESRVGNEIKKNAYFAAAEALQKQQKCVNTTRCEGPISGVEVGDRFQCRGELFVIGLHRQLTKGIDSIKVDGRSIAISVVASDFYDNDMRSPGVLIYCGEGGNPRFKGKKPADQKLTRGNLALKNSIGAKNSVRVIRCYNRPKPSEQGLKRIFVYDGLYNVEKFIQERGEIGKLVFKFTLKRLTGQPELALGTYS